LLLSEGVGRNKSELIATREIKVARISLTILKKIKRA
jgi:hypothetical protein